MGIDHERPMYTFVAVAFVLRCGRSSDQHRPTRTHQRRSQPASLAGTTLLPRAAPARPRPSAPPSTPPTRRFGRRLAPPRPPPTTSSAAVHRTIVGPRRGAPTSRVRPPRPPTPRPPATSTRPSRQTADEAPSIEGAPPPGTRPRCRHWRPGHRLARPSGPTGSAVKWWAGQEPAARPGRQNPEHPRRRPRDGEPTERGRGAPSGTAPTEATEPTDPDTEEPVTEPTATR